MKRVLVAGGAGFLGTNLCRALLSRGNLVTCMDNFYTGRKENIADLLQNSNFKLYEHNIIEPIPEEIEVEEIYNMACPASPPHYQKDPIYTTKTSVIGVLNLLEHAKKKQAKLLQASTSEIYGEPQEHPQKETYRGNVNPIGIRSCYDEGKRCAESIVFDYHRKHDVPIKVIRIFNTYGPYMDPNDGRVVSNFIVQALKGENLTIYGDGSQTRSLCYVDDMVEGIIRMMESEDGFIGPVNLGNPEEYTVKEIAEKIIRLRGANSELVYMELPKDDPTQRRPDIGLAEEKLQWKPGIQTDIGIQKTAAYFSQLIMA